MGCVATFGKPTHPIWLILRSPPDQSVLYFGHFWDFFVNGFAQHKKILRTFQDFEQNDHTTLRISKDPPFCGGVNVLDDPHTQNDAAFERVSDS